MKNVDNLKFKSELEAFLSSKEGVCPSSEKEESRDYSLLLELSKNPLFGRRAYFKDGSHEILISLYDDESGLYSGSYTWANIFGSLDDAVQTEIVKFPFGHHSFVPAGSIFFGYKNEISIEPIFSPSEANLKVVNDIISKYSLLALGLPDDALLLFNAYSMTCCLASPSWSHPFITVFEGQLIGFDSVDYALKYSYEEARIACKYLPPESRDRLKSLTEYFESSDFSEKIEEDLLKRKEVSDALKSYFDSDVFNKDIEEIKQFISEENEHQLSSEDYLYGDSPKIDETKFWQVFDAVFQEIPSFEDDSVGFSNQNIDYKGLRFFKMHGQGTFCAIRISFPLEDC